MLKMVSKKSMLLLGVVMALCAFVLPSVASAASWFRWVLRMAGLTRATSGS